MVWLDVLGPDGPSAGALCRRHADALVVPRGWWLQDRRSDAALFAPPEPAPPAVLYRPKRRRRPSPPPDPRPDVAAEGDPAPVAWKPTFDAGDDLNGLLDAKTPLLARAFRRQAAAPE